MSEFYVIKQVNEFLIRTKINKTLYDYKMKIHQTSFTYFRIVEIILLLIRSTEEELCECKIFLYPLVRKCNSQLRQKYLRFLPVNMMRSDSLQSYISVPKMVVFFSRTNFLRIIKILNLQSSLQEIMVSRSL